MPRQHQIGQTGTTRGPLKPTGRIEVDGQTLDAKAESGWIDADTEVVIIAGHAGLVTVREASEVTTSPEDSGAPLAAAPRPEVTPLQSPPAFVERTNHPLLGLIVGGLVSGILLWRGAPGGWDVALPLVAGFLAGKLARVFIGGAVEAEASREDHRPAARVIAIGLAGSTILGIIVALNLQSTYISGSAGLLAGTALGGIFLWLGYLLLEVL